MGNLNENWLTEKLVDKEYKKYVLLAYLQDVGKKFNKTKLYPHFAELKVHCTNLINLEKHTNHLRRQFPLAISNINLDKREIRYKHAIVESAIMQELREIIQFSIPTMQACIEDGKQILEFIEEHINIEPVGITPLNTNEGYLMLCNPFRKINSVYHYTITLYKKPGEGSRFIHTKFIQSYNMSIANTVESVKRDVIRNLKMIPNPATYFVETDLSIPLNESYLPIAKKMLVKYVTNNEPEQIN
ncbi:MAG: hypothetical protein COB85_06255 [Bacteroidetes bacterium]|nr:MAG: hypothetical protein COB85_06255 [Bacteroidota bacterium]